MALLVLNGTEQDISKFIIPFTSEKNFFFYTVTVFETDLQWHQVIALRSGFSVNKIQFLDGMIIDDSYFDLKGLTISSIDLDWEPYLWISDCEKDNKGCKVNGFMVDLVDLIAGRLNFTYDSTKVQSCIRSLVKYRLSRSLKAKNKFVFKTMKSSKVIYLELLC